MNILFADDNPDVRELVTMGLVGRGHDVTVVQNGTELLKILKHGPGKFDAIVTDNSMPGGPSGIEVLRRLRSDERFKKIPIIVHSGDRAAAFQIEIAALDAVFASKGQSNSLFGALDDVHK